MIICYYLQKPKFPRKLPKLCKNDNRPKENFFYVISYSKKNIILTIYENNLLLQKNYSLLKPSDIKAAVCGFFAQFVKHFHHTIFLGKF